MPLVNFWGMTSHLTSIGICSRRVCQDDAGVCRSGFFFFWCCLCWQPGDSTMELSSSLLVAKNPSNKTLFGVENAGKTRLQPPPISNATGGGRAEAWRKGACHGGGWTSNVGNGQFLGIFGPPKQKMAFSQVGIAIFFRVGLDKLSGSSIRKTTVVGAPLFTLHHYHFYIESCSLNLYAFIFLRPLAQSYCSFGPTVGENPPGWNF